MTNTFALAFVSGEWQRGLQQRGGPQEKKKKKEHLFTDCRKPKAIPPCLTQILLAYR
ncbi:MAG: hypothetical protein OXD49_13350 [Candidatus Poribacteria bacterium]|nr:hypothetical protein [Candidatus Poribacteria bacterium]